ncbi:zinc finger protein 567-like [Papilio machaon]|uniref:zinc finger protein 567-like n=1 Tax=Papilio machaon TaxID=76193 RepID=UPI001E6629E5|nr:zinc finger protein 567-like [Papilio machaon]
MEITENYTKKCLTCFKLFLTQTDLVKHYSKDHKNNKNKDAKDNIYEIVTDDNNFKYKCRKCDKLFQSKVKINKHILCHTQERPFVCKLCGRTYKVASDIVRHGRVHDGLKVPCKFRCGYSTVYKGALKQHEKRHKKEYTYTCDKCNKGFEVLTWYEQHQNIHTGDKPFVCNVCGVAFHMDRNRIGRLSGFGGSRRGDTLEGELSCLCVLFSMLECNVHFFRYLQVHIRSVHPQSYVEERFLCVHCSKPCSSKKALTLHLKEHGITSKFLCDMCGKVFSEARLLRIHKRMHLGIRPYSCSICKKTFAKRSNLTVHVQTHSGERSHACESCGKRYTQRGTLLRHVQRFHKGTSLEVVRNET